MMLRAKLFLLCLLALAIPVQGFAAALQACAPAVQSSARHHAPSAPAAPAAHSAGMQHEHHAPQGHHGAAAQTVADQSAETVHQPDPPHHTQASCSFCAACTVGGLLPLALSAPPAPDLPSREFIALPASGFVGYLPENPDRPPALA